MLQNPRKTLGFKKIMVYKILPGGGGGGDKPFPDSDLLNISAVHQKHKPKRGIHIYFTFSKKPKFE